MDFYKYADKGNEILHEVAEELGFPNDHKLAMRLLRSVLHVLRDRLTIEESFHMIAQLPLVIKGLYVEGWNIHKEHKKPKNIGDFIKEVIKNDYPVGHHDVTGTKDGQNAIMAVFKVLKKHVSEGEIQDMIAVMPDELRPLWGEMPAKNHM